MQETTQWPSVTASYLRFPVSHYPLTVTLRNGAAIELLEPTDVSTLWQIFFHRAYPVYPSDRSILDAGANIGLFALYAARRAPASTIYCIEPFPDTFNRLCETVRKNRLSDRVICSNLALAGNAGTYLMGCGPRPSQRRQLLSEQTAQVRSLPVSGTTLEIWMNDKNVGELDLMKMDIEGSEYDVLLSTPAAVLRRIHRIILEYHNIDGSQHAKHELCDHLRNANFHLVSDLQNEEGYGVLEAVLRN